MTDVNAQTLGLELLPADDEGIPPASDVAAAEASALEADPPLPASEDAPLPIGETWHFDFNETKEFVEAGTGPARATGAHTIWQWCLMAAFSARYAHSIFTDEFAMEEPEFPIGEVVTSDMVADYEVRLREAWLVHDRIAAVENFEARANPLTGVLEIDRVDVVLDDDTLIALGGFSIPEGDY